MSGEAYRFWEGAAARRGDSLQARLRALLSLLEEPELNVGAALAIMRERDEHGKTLSQRWKLALTQLERRLQREVETRRKDRRMLPEDPSGSDSLRAEGWEPCVEIVQRMERMWGTATVEEKPHELRMRLTWPESGARAYLRAHPQNAAWWRCDWASWREGEERPPGIQEALGVHGDDVFAVKESA